MRSTQHPAVPSWVPSFPETTRFRFFVEDVPWGFQYLWAVLTSELDMSQPSALVTQRANCILECIRPSGAWACVAAPQALCEVLGPQHKKDIKPLESIQRKDPKMVKGLEVKVYESDWGPLVSSAQRRGGWEEASWWPTASSQGEKGSKCWCFWWQQQDLREWHEVASEESHRITEVGKVLQDHPVQLSTCHQYFSLNCVPQYNI